MIKSFADKETRKLFEGSKSKAVPPDVRVRAESKLAFLDAATSLKDLRATQSNRLHKLSGDRQGQWAISINAQYRVCFVWEDGDAYEVEVTDYHD